MKFLGILGVDRRNTETENRIEGKGPISPSPGFHLLIWFAF